MMVSLIQKAEMIERTNTLTVNEQKREEEEEEKQILITKILRES